MASKETPVGIIAGILIVGTVYLLAKAKERGRQFLCLKCHYSGRAKKEVKGHFLVEVILWLAMILPGLIYTLWRSTSRKPSCPKCDSIEMIPIDSPKAIEILKSKSS